MRRHEFDPISLVFGAIFAAVGLVFLFGNVDVGRVPPAWSWPIPLMVVGALIVLLAIRRDRPIDVTPPAAHPGMDADEKVKLPDEP